MIRPLRPAVFLDRDGTLVAERPGVWIDRPTRVRLLPGAAEAVRRLNRAGHLVVLVTNQSALARGLLDEEGLARVHERLATLLAAEGARLDLLLHCPHHPTEGRPPLRRRCACRKPGRGLVLEARRRLPIALRRSCVIGDDVRDVLLARRSPLLPILVRTGKGREAEATARRSVGRRLVVVDDLAQAVDVWLRRSRRGAQGR